MLTCCVVLSGEQKPRLQTGLESHKCVCVEDETSSTPGTLSFVLERALTYAALRFETNKEGVGEQGNTRCVEDNTLPREN